jgi:hypothetical protein
VVASLARWLRYRRAVEAAARAAAERGDRLYPSRLRLIKDAARLEAGLRPARGRAAGGKVTPPP